MEVPSTHDLSNLHCSFYTGVRRCRRVVFLLSLLFMLLVSQLLRAQSFDASGLHVPSELSSNWLIQAGDDLTYARPDFDDSHWTLFDPHTSLDKIWGKTRPSIVWYRLHVKVDPTESGLALNEWGISRAFEIYVNGELLMVSGRVAPFMPYTSDARVLRRIPDRMLHTGSIVIAMRVHIAPSEWGNGQDPGYYVNNLAIGQYDTLYRETWLAVIGQNALSWLNQGLLIWLGVVALTLFASERRNSQYLWIAALGAMTLAEFPEPFVAAFHNIPIVWQLISELPRVASPYLWVSLYFSFVRKHIGWGWKIFLIFAGLLNAFANAQALFLSIPLSFLIPLNLPFIVLLSVIIPVVLILHLHRGNREAGILLIPVLLFSLYVYAEVVLATLFQFPAWRVSAIHGLNLIDRYPAGPFFLSLDYISGILSTVSLAIIMLLRFTTLSRRQATLENELAAAQEVQQILLPDNAEVVKGFTVESAYEPAQQVGGDFFQILPVDGGGLLVVVGDVAGKGLPAAMLVSVLVGAIRAVTKYISNPADLLADLNERLVGRVGGGFTTALAARISEDGAVVIANAGHLPPYLDGKEIELPGALPLGIKAGAQYETVRFRMQSGARLTFYSDGIAEAQNANGELFGFERCREVSTQPVGAILEAARRFGQQDDMTAISIVRNAPRAREAAQTEKVGVGTPALAS